MGIMKDFDIRIRHGGDDAIAAVSEYVESLHNELARQSRLMHDARIMLVGSPVGSGCYEAFRLLNEEPSPWIPVSERLPEKGVPVIGWFPGATQSFECSLNEHDGVWCDWGTGIYLYEDERPTHWMPFPDGPTDAK